MSTMSTIDDTVSALPTTATAGPTTESLPQADVSVVPRSTAPIQAGCTHVHPTASSLDTLSLSIQSIDRLQSDNWLAWKHRVSIVLERHGLFHLVTGAESPPPSASRTDAAWARWHARDLAAQELLVSTLSDHQLMHVVGCPTAAAIWRALVTVHEPETWLFTAQAALARRLYTASMEEDADVPARLQEMVAWRTRLVGAGRTVGDVEFARAVMESLPPSWTVWVGWGLQTSMSVQEIVTVVNGEYKRRMAEADGAVRKEITYTVDSVKETRKSKGTRRSKRCDVCDVFGHAEKDCWYNPANRGKGRVNKGRRMASRKTRNNVQRACAPIETVELPCLNEWDDSDSG